MKYQYVHPEMNQAIAHLHELYSITDNLLYHSHSPESLAKKLAEIQESISYLESLENNNALS